MLNKPRIAIFLATSGHSGVDRIAKLLVPELARRGYTVDLLQVERHGPHIEPLPPGVHRIPMGTRHVYSAFPALVRYLRRHRPDVLFSDKDRVNRTALLAVGLTRVKTRVVVSMGTTLSIELAHRDWLDRRLQIASMRYLYPKARNVIVTSHGVADDMADYTGLGREFITPLPPPTIDQERVIGAHTHPPPHPWFGNDNVPVILGVGELSARKDYATLIRAFAALRARRDCRLILLGEGRHRDELTDLSNDLKVAGDVTLPGFVDDPYPWMAHAHVFAHTSRWEGLGMVLAEALALGTQVVATDCPSGPAEILDHGRLGTLVPVGDATALAAALNHTLDNPKPSEALREAARPYFAGPATAAYLTAMGLPTGVNHE